MPRSDRSAALDMLTFFGRHSVMAVDLILNL
jgi:hypothetical protein